MQSNVTGAVRRLGSARQRLSASCCAYRNGPSTRNLATSATMPIENKTSSVNQAEIAHFSRLSSLWWDETGEFGQLHRMNPVRIQFIREKLLEVAREEQGEARGQQIEHSPRALDRLDVLDVGCGGGLLSESLARMGARTLGVDASASNVSIASLHASADPALSSSNGPYSLTYRHSSAEELLQEPARFDVVCSLEVVEHVDNPAAFLKTCADLVKPGGHLFLSTIARTPLAYFMTIAAAEHILKLVSPGTHTYSKYINPKELVAYFQEHRTNPSSPPWISRLHQYNQSLFPSSHPSRQEAEVRGLVYQPWNGAWVLMPRSASMGLSGWATTQCNYMFWVRKPRD